MDDINLQDQNDQNIVDETNEIAGQDQDNLTEMQKLQDSYTRLLAELVNTRRNMDSEIQKSKQSIMLKIIALLDTYKILLENVQDKEHEAYQSLNDILEQLSVLLATERVKKLEIKVGDKFDPNTSEAISMQESDESDKVLAIVSPAYEISGQILKTAKVIVSKPKQT